MCHNNTSQEPPRQHNSKTLAAPPATNPLKCLAALVSPSTASCSGQRSSRPTEEAHRIDARTDVASGKRRAAHSSPISSSKASAWQTFGQGWDPFREERGPPQTIDSPTPSTFRWGRQDHCRGKLCSQLQVSGPPSHPLPHSSPSDSRPQGVPDPSETSGVGLGAFLQSQQTQELSPEPYNYETKTPAEIQS